MGRDSGGYISTSQCKRIDLSYLLNRNIIQNDSRATASYNQLE
jgi:hypothetical protein